jgi:mRNA interferase RelE/StbE
MIDMTDASDPSLAADHLPAPFADALARAEHDKGRTLLTRAGRPVAALVPIEDVQALAAMEDSRDAEAVRQGLDEYDREGADWPSHSADELAALWGIDPPGPAGTMIWRLAFRPSARRQFEALDAPTGERIRRALLRIAADPRTGPDVKRMQGGGSRMHVVDWRVVYALEDDKVLIFALRTGHRRETYR